MKLSCRKYTNDSHPDKGAALAMLTVAVTALQQVSEAPSAQGVRVAVKLSSPIESNVVWHSSGVGICEPVHNMCT